MRPSTLSELCLRYGMARPADTRGRSFDNFGGFVGMYWAACNSIRSRDDLARLILEIAEDAAFVAAEDLRVVRERYSVGAATVLDVLVSQAAATQSNADVVTTRYDYILALLQLKQAAGTLSETDLERVNGWLQEN